MTKVKLKGKGGPGETTDTSLKRKECVEKYVLEFILIFHLNFSGTIPHCLNYIGQPANRILCSQHGLSVSGTVWGCAHAQSYQILV